MVRDLLHNVQNDRFAHSLSKQTIEWKFNQPSSREMNRSWKPLIKSIKRALKSTILDRIRTDKMLKTIMCEIESLINQILIMHISDGINDFECLTSKHSLIGETNSYTPPGVNEKKTLVPARNGYLSYYRISKILD